MNEKSELTAYQQTIQNIMTYGTPAAKAEVFVKLILLDNAELLEKVYNQFSDKELNRILAFA